MCEITERKREKETETKKIKDERVERHEAFVTGRWE
jgi:hypothetical protein